MWSEHSSRLHVFFYVFTLLSLNNTCGCVALAVYNMVCAMANNNLSNAKNAKNDEFYTQYQDIEKEVNAYLEYNPDVFKDKIMH